MPLKIESLDDSLVSKDASFVANAEGLINAHITFNLLKLKGRTATEEDECLITEG